MLCVYGRNAGVCAEVKIMDRKLAEPSHQLIDKICDKTEGALWPLIMAQLANWQWQRGASRCRGLQTLSRCLHIHYVGLTEGGYLRLPWSAGRGHLSGAPPRTVTYFLRDIGL